MKHNISLAASVLLLGLSGCAMGPDFKKPAPPPVHGYTAQPLTTQVGSQAQQFVEGRDIPAEWWTLFHSPALNSLVQQALQANPSLDAAKAALRQSQENVYAAEGTLFPSVNAGASAVHQKTTGAQFGRPGTPGSVFTLYNASVNVSYGLDLFGVARRELESLEAQSEYQRFQLEAAYLTLTSNVVTTAMQEASLRAQVAAIKEIVDLQSQQFDVLQHQYAVGAVAQTSVLAQQTVLAQTRANLPILEKQLALVRNQLAVLAGNFPGQDNGATFDLDALQLPRELPLSLPSKLVEQRPDIRAAEAMLHSASAQVGVATANLLPQFTISANAASVATTASSLFTSGSGIWSLGANLTQPIFHGGTLVHERRAAEAAFDAAAAQYRSVVLAAFQNVANVLEALQADATILQAQTLAAQSASDSLEIARKQYQIGVISYLALLNAQQAYQQARIALVQAQATRYADTAALFQSLGGGWWNRNDVSGDAAKPADEQKTAESKK